MYTVKLIDNKWVFTDNELDQQISRGKEFHQTAEGRRTDAASFRYEPVTRTFSIRLADGSGIDFPVSKIKELRNATDEAIGSARISQDGDAIHWDRLDAHYTVAGLAAAIFGTQEWMREIGKKGGSTSSPAKANAARLNGRKGGRPRSAKTPGTGAAGQVMELSRKK